MKTIDEFFERFEEIVGNFKWILVTFPGGCHNKQIRTSDESYCPIEAVFKVHGAYILTDKAGWVPSVRNAIIAAADNNINHPAFHLSVRNRLLKVLGFKEII